MAVSYRIGRLYLSKLPQSKMLDDFTTRGIAENRAVRIVAPAWCSGSTAPPKGRSPKADRTRRRLAERSADWPPNLVGMAMRGYAGCSAKIAGEWGFPG